MVRIHKAERDDKSTPHQARYLLQETILILLLGYALLLGGTYNGLVLSDLRLVTTWLLALAGGVWLAARLSWRWPFPRTPLDLPLLGYLAVHVVTAILSSDPRRSAIYVWLLGVYLLLFYLFVDLLRHGWPSELFAKSLLVVSVIVLGFGLRELALWYSAWHDIWGWARLLPTIVTRVHAFLGHPNWVAAFLNLLWPLALLRLLSTRARFPRLLLTAWLLAAAILMYFTSSRGGWIGTGAAAAVLLLAGNLRHRIVENIKNQIAKVRSPGPGLKFGFWHLMLALAALSASLIVLWLAGRQLSHPTHGSFVDARRDLWESALVAFRSRPIWGTGPFTYGETFLSTHSVPPGELFGVAHNYSINLAAESGLIGLAALAWLAAALVRALWRSWQRSAQDPGRRAILLGALAALAGCAAHSLFDSIETVPSLCVIIAILLAICLSDESPRAARPRGLTWALPLGWVILSASAIWSTEIYRPFAQGVLAGNLGLWSQAAPQLDWAAQHDPNMAIYHLQAGYAHGVRAAQGDPNELAAAIAHYRAGIAGSPHYALNAANLGALYHQAGDLSQAITWMQQAADQAPQSAVIALNLGELYEESSQAEQARRWYSAALDSAPEWIEAAFWRATPLRAAIASDWRQAHPPPEPAKAPRTPDEWLTAGSSALEKGRADEALAAFERAIQQDPNRTAAYLAQARAYTALGRKADAERSLRTGLMAEGGGTLDHLRAQFALGRLYYERQDTSQAISLYEQALDVVRHASAFGPGGPGASDYAWYLFYSETLSSDLLPQLSNIAITDEIAARMIELGRWYEETGDHAAAQRIYREALSAAPDLAQ